MMKNCLFKRLIATVLLLVMIVGFLPMQMLTTQVEAADTTNAATTGLAKNVGSYYLAESIPTVEGCYAQQGMGLLGDYIYTAQINEAEKKQVIYRTSRLTGETVPMTIDGAAYSTVMGHCNDMCGITIGNNSYLFVTLLKEKNGSTTVNLNKIKCLKISGTSLTTVATYSIVKEDGSDLLSSGLSIYDVNGNNVKLLVTSGNVNYFATFNVAGGDATVTCEFAFQLDNADLNEKSCAIVGHSVNNLVVQGSCYADGVFYMPVCLAHKAIPVDNHADSIIGVLVYPNIDEAIATKDKAVKASIEDSFRIPQPQNIWTDIESIAVADGVIYFNSTRIILDESTVTSISFLTDEYSDIAVQRAAFQYDSVYLLTAPSNQADIVVDVGAADGHLEVKRVTATRSAWFGFENNGYGYYFIKNMSTKKYLTVNDDGSVTQTAKTGALNQLWAITQTDWPTSNQKVAILSLYKPTQKSYLNVNTADSNRVITNSSGKTFILKEAVDKTTLETYLFSEKIYEACYPDLPDMTREEGIAHYMSTGLAEGRLASFIFDPKYYVANNPDLGLTSYQEAYEHFLNYGYWEGRQGSLFFSCNEYLHQEGSSLKTGDYPEKAYYATHFYHNGANESLNREDRDGSDEFNIREIVENLFSHRPVALISLWSISNEMRHCVW